METASGKAFDPLNETENNSALLAAINARVGKLGSESEDFYALIIEVDLLWEESFVQKFILMRKLEDDVMFAHQMMQHLARRANLNQAD